MDAPAQNPFPVVGIGASAGGLGALTQLLGALPPRPGLAVVVIEHLDPKHQSQLSELLQPHTSMAVVEADHGAKVAPDVVYVIRPNTSVAIADGILWLLKTAYVLTPLQLRTLSGTLLSR